MTEKISKSRVNLFSDLNGVSIGKNSLVIEHESSSKKVQYGDIVGFCFIERFFFGHTLSITTADKIITVEGLSHLRAIRQFNLLNSRVAKYIESEIDSVFIEFIEKVTKKYLRHSHVKGVEKALEHIVRRYNAHAQVWGENISQEHLKRIRRLSRWFPLKSSIKLFQRFYSKKVLQERSYFYDSIESNPLTEEQRFSVVQDDDFNMVLAAAGTGKTSVIVAKAADIIDRKLAPPSKVMVLAFAGDAADELKHRSKERLHESGITFDLDKQISTFHSRGFQIVSTVENMDVEEYKRLKLSPLSNPKKKKPREDFINNWLVSFIEKSHENRSAFITTVYYAFNPFNTKSEDEYQRVLRDNKYKTLNGITVKGYQEVLIGNWLFLNGIEFEYESNYGLDNNLNLGYAYHPDFHIVGTNIYVEHFGIDHKGNTRADIDKDKYKAQIVEKKQLHTRLGTELVDTYHYYWCDGVLEAKLQEKLAKYGIMPKPISADRVMEALRENKFIENGASNLDKALAAVRAEGISGHEILEALELANLDNAKQHAYVVESLREAYVSELRSSKKIDFDDMILLATQYIQEGKYTPEWKYILADEFQDISRSRWQLLIELLKAPDSSLTVVGDDWQSIFAFNGGKLEYTTLFGEKVGAHSLVKLQKTFRYNNSIADTAGSFVMKNPQQFKKYIETQAKVTKSQVYLMDNLFKGEIDQIKSIESPILKINKSSPDASIAIMSRYRKTLKKAKARFKTELGLQNLKFWTFHGSKGLEADYCFILDLNQGYFGFPTERMEDMVISALMPSNETYQHAEERRLMYVAITRAKKSCILVADPYEPSEFVLELLSESYDIRLLSEHFTKEGLSQRKCPNCKYGYFKPRYKWVGYYDCSTGQGCKTVAVDCQKCDGIAVTNKRVGSCLKCATKFQLCPRCAAPKVVRINSKSKRPFIGCYAHAGQSDKSCNFTENLPYQLHDTLQEKDRVPC